MTKQNKPIVIKETSADGSTQTYTINTGGGNYNHSVKGDVVQGDYVEGETKTKR